MTAQYATLRFYSNLADLAPDADRRGEVTVTFDAPRSVKDAIESAGVPHTEVDLLLVNREPVDFDRRLEDGDHVSVYPPFAALDVDVVSKVRPDPLPEHRFVCDVHLGRLAERLRTLGFDAAYENHLDDPELVGISVEERRWLLTRDRGLLMRAAVTHGYLVRTDYPVEQTVEVVRRFGLAGDLEPFSRCVRCGGQLRDVEKEQIADELEPGTRRDHDDFVRCARCGQIYWRGSHHGSLRDFVDEVRARTSDAPG